MRVWKSGSKGRDSLPFGRRLDTVSRRETSPSRACASFLVAHGRALRPPPRANAQPPPAEIARLPPRRPCASSRAAFTRALARAADQSCPANERLEYRIRWRGYGPAEDSWKPIDELLDCIDLVRVYNQVHPLKTHAERVHQSKQLELTPGMDQLPQPPMSGKKAPAFRTHPTPHPRYVTNEGRSGSGSDSDSSDGEDPAAAGFGEFEDYDQDGFADDSYEHRIMCNPPML